MNSVRMAHQGISSGRNLMKAGQHFAFWLAAYLFFILFFGRANRDYQTTIIFASMLFPLAIFTSYFLNYFLIPRYLYKAEYWRFLLFLFYTLVFTLWSEVMISLFVFIIVSDFQVSRLDPTSFDVVFLLVGLYFIIIGFVAIEQIKRAFEMKQENTRLEKHQMETELKLRESELKLLRAQVHPHFLFNTLNNLYGLTLEKSDLAPELVLKLSDLMDYMLYKCNKPRVSLKSELEHLKNYMEIERIRYGEKLHVDFKTEGSVDQLEIAPMLLLAFFENAFKHGVSKSISNPFVRIRIWIDGNNFRLNMVNRCTPDTQNEEDYTKGIGLKNVKKRLELLYPEHRLQVISQPDIFEIDLQLILDKGSNQNKENQWTN
ncbi:sensor histidine kinase [Gaoshiqia sediminis]|uniref:Histidine kinase n=1 Tax=Gaoshiqia sediminis TaxID=2986998 RepID=A0AA41Y8R8_9BACT|nr:histidine kinase [Gaoshiqia sediminis]MCW0483960.1 histidine kinase [Gaoshiqia sediminis]